jgi:hypothetical protein
MNPSLSLRSSMCAALLSLAAMPLGFAHAQCFQSSGYLPADAALGIGMVSCEVVSSGDGTTLLIAGPNATSLYIKNTSLAGWALQSAIPPASGTLQRFGALSDDGNIAVATATPSTFVYTRSGTTWSLAQTLPVSAAQGDADISSDGSRIFVRHFPTNSVQVFRRPAPGQPWAFEADLLQLPVTPQTTSFGLRINCSADGRSVIVTGNTSMVATYDLVNGVWNARTALVPTGSVAFESRSAAIDRSGTWLAYGNRPQQRVFIYQRTPGDGTQAPGEWTPHSVLLPSGGVTSSSFGEEVAWSPDSRLLAVADPQLAAGVVHMYARGETDQFRPAFDPIGPSPAPTGSTPSGFGNGLSWASNGLVAVSGDIQSTPSTTGAVRLLAAPSSILAITQQPASQSIAAGQSAAFTIAISGPSIPTFRWRRNGQALVDGPRPESSTVVSGSNTPTLTLTGVAESDTGCVYDCVISSGCQAFASDPAVLLLVSSCPADFNNSGGLSVQDIFDFLAAYFAGCP